MAKQKLVTKADDNTWDFRCGYPTGCGEPGGKPFESLGWGKREDAAARGRQHLDEHEGKGVAPDLDTFRKERGLTVDTAGAVDPSQWEL